MTPLVPHPSTPETGFGVAAGVEWVRTSTLRLAYRVVGAIDAVRVPPPARAERTDGLWEHTCFEAFLAVEGETRYVEMNLAPSRRWAVYAFTGYRERAPVDPDTIPEIVVTRGDHALDVAATLPFGAADLRVGLTAVMERTDGRRSYWALCHPAAMPDFHHADGFAIRLPATVGP